MAGFGELVALAGSSMGACRGWQVEGVEPSRWAANYARENLALDIHNGTIDDGEFNAEPGRYDVIFLWDVLEHVPDPVGLLTDTHRLLKEDGIMVLSTLDIDNWFPRLLGRRWPWYMDMHIFYYSAAVMEEVYRRSGFKMKKVETYWHYASVHYAMEKLASFLPVGVRHLARLLTPLTPRFLKIPIGFGDIKIYVGSRVPVEALERAPVRQAVAAGAEE